MSTPSVRRGLRLGAAGVFAVTIAVAGAAHGGALASSRTASAPAGDPVAAAQAAVAPYFDPPTSIGTDVPLSAPPPADKHVIALSCSLDVCQDWRDQVGVAAESLGWTSEGIAFTGTPEDTLAKVNQAVSEAPDAIVINGVPRETYEEAAQAAADAGIPIVTQMGELEGDVVAPFIAVQYRAEQFDTMATATGNWVIADSDGAANAIVVEYAGLPLSQEIAEKMQSTIDENCPDCATKLITAQLADTGTALPGMIVSELQRDPSINYVVLQDAAMATGLDVALREADLTGKVSVIGNNVTDQAIQGVLNGDYTGFMAFSLRAAAFAGIDAVARYLVGDEPQDVPLMNQIFTIDNLPADPTADTWENLPTDLAAQYQALWLGSGTPTTTT